MGEARAALDALLEGASTAALLEPATIYAWSCADVLAHLAGYTRSIADELAASRAEARHGPDYPAPPDAGTDEYNAIVVAHWRDRRLVELLEEERVAFAALVDEVRFLPDNALRDVTRFPFINGRSLAAVLPNNSYAHYEMHLPQLRSALGAAGRTSPRSGGVNP